MNKELLLSSLGLYPIFWKELLSWLSMRLEEGNLFPAVPENRGFIYSFLKKVNNFWPSDLRICPEESFSFSDVDEARIWLLERF
jgi:hypothetical protein